MGANNVEAGNAGANNGGGRASLVVGMRFFVWMGIGVVAGAQFLTSAPDVVDAATRAEMLRRACGAEIVKGLCPANPIDGGSGSWSIQAVKLGHFLSAKSEDAIVTTSSFKPVAWFPVGSFLMSRREGKWGVVGVYRVHLDLRTCRKVKTGAGRDAMVCQIQSRSVNTNYSTVAFVEGSDEDLEVTEMFTATDSTERCAPSEPSDKIQRAVIDGLELGEAPLKVTVKARYGAVPYTAALERQCQQATAKLKGAKFPSPEVKDYVLEYVFDGKKFRPAAGSAAAARLFQ